MPKKSNVLVFHAVVATADEEISNIFTCGMFMNEKDAVIAVLKTAFRHHLIKISSQSRLRFRFREYVFDDECYDDDNDANDADEEDDDENYQQVNYVEQSEKARFKKMIFEEVKKKPTASGLKEVLVYYTDYDNQLWSFNIDCYNI